MGNRTEGLRSRAAGSGSYFRRKTSIQSRNKSRMNRAGVLGSKRHVEVRGARRIGEIQGVPDSCL